MKPRQLSKLGKALTITAAIASTLSLNVSHAQALNGLVLVPVYNITVQAFYDMNGNGAWDTGEPEFGSDQCVDTNGTLGDCSDSNYSGWPITLEKVGSQALEYTTTSQIAAVAGDYVICETNVEGWSTTASIVDGLVENPPKQCVDISVSNTPGEMHTVVFGNFIDSLPQGCAPGLWKTHSRCQPGMSMEAQRARR